MFGALRERDVQMRQLLALHHHNLYMGLKKHTMKHINIRTRHRYGIQFGLLVLVDTHLWNHNATE